MAVPAGAGQESVSDNVTTLGRAKASSWLHRATIRKDHIFAAFHGLGSGFDVFRIGDHGEPPLRKVSSFPCPGNQEGTISHWRHFVFQALESPSPEAGKYVSECGEEQGGIRVVDVSNPRNPHKVGFIDLACGSHGMTVFEDKGRVFIYNTNACSGQGEITGSTGQGGQLNTVRKIDVIEFDPEHPSKPFSRQTPEIEGMAGCHDLTVFPPRDLAVCTGTGRFALVDISDPYNPVIIGAPIDDFSTGAGSAQFTWDGQYIMLNEIPGRGYASYFGCFGAHKEHAYRLRIWNVEDPETPLEVGQYSIDREPVLWTPGEDHRCHPSNFTVVPMNNPARYVAVTSWGLTGMSVIDFTDPGDIKEIAYLQLLDANNMYWAAWYNGRVYVSENEGCEGCQFPTESWPVKTEEARANARALRIDGLGPRETRYFKEGLVTQWQDPSNLGR